MSSYRVIAAIIFIFLLSLTTSKQVFAQSVLVVCDSCFNSSNFHSRALATQSAHNTVVSVVNPRTGVIEKYQIFEEWEPTFGLLQSVEQLTPTNREYQLVNEIRQAREEIDEILFTNKQIPDYLASSALQLIGNYRLQNNVSSYFNSKITSADVWDLYWGTLVSLGGSIQGAAITVEFSFSDGSKAILQLAGLNSVSTGRVFDFTLQQVWDRAGNKVPIGKNEFAERSGDIYHAHVSAVMYELLQVSSRYGFEGLYFTPDSWGGGGYVTLTDCPSATDCNRTN